MDKPYYALNLTTVLPEEVITVLPEGVILATAVVFGLGGLLLYGLFGNKPNTSVVAPDNVEVVTQTTTVTELVTPPTITEVVTQTTVTVVNNVQQITEKVQVIVKNMFVIDFNSFSEYHYIILKAICLNEYGLRRITSPELFIKLFYEIHDPVASMVLRMHYHKYNEIYYLLKRQICFLVHAIFL